MLVFFKSVGKPIHNEESGGKSGSQMAQSRLCGIGISGCGDAPVKIVSH
jgi:hypothetical protein